MTTTGFLRNFIYAITAGLLLYSCTGDGEGPDPSTMNFDLLEGKWSITQEVRKVYDDDGQIVDTRTETTNKNAFTIEFLSANTARIIQVEEAMWAEADYTLNREDSTLRISFTFGDEDVDVTLKILSLSETAGTLFEEGTDNHDGAVYSYESTMAISKNDDSIPVITAEDLKGKWSTISQMMVGLVDENNDGNFDEQNEVMMDMNLSQIPHNRLTVEFLDDNTVRRIDTYLESKVDESSEWELLDGSNIIISNDEEDPFLIHIVSLTGNVMEATFYQYNEENFGGGSPVQVKSINNLTISKNDGTEPIMTQTELTAEWIMMDFVELKDGVDVTGSDNPAGSLIILRSDGTGTLQVSMTTMHFTWEMVDGSNFYFTGEFDGEGNGVNTMLFNISAYNASTGLLNLVEGRMDFENENEILRETQIELKIDDQ